ncbi:MAG: metal ABC transporter permease [Deltaproteobacteria bacterium]|nr:metal ABC transporter permease [Deltaproteobacteria bacterium]
MAQPLSDFFAAWELFREPALAGAVSGLLLGWVGVYVALRRMVFLSAAMTQTAGLGVMLAQSAAATFAIAGLAASPTLWALAFSGLAAAALAGAERLRLGRDQVLGALYLLGAAGAILVGAKVAVDAHDIETVLFGSAVAVAPEDFQRLVVTAVGLLALHLWLGRGFVAAAFDPEGAAARRLPVVLLKVLLLATVALAVSVTTRTIGALPVFAFSTLPALAASRLCPSLGTTLPVAAVLGAVAGFGGYLAAFVWELPVGASQTAVALLLFAGAAALGRLLRR